MRRAFSLATQCLLPRPAGLRVSSAAASRVSSAASLCSVRCASHAGLMDASRRELEEEQQRDGKPVQPATPQGWTVETKTGTRGFTMKRKYEDEDILVRCYGEMEESDPVALGVSVYVTRNGPTMVFDLNIESGEIVLNNVSFFKEEALAKDESAEGETKRSHMYEGPSFEELDSELVNSFISYLESRGINDELGTFIDQYGYWAEQAEYEAWLQAVNRFVS